MLSLLLAAQVAAVASDAAPAPAVVPPVVADAPTSITLPALTIVRIRVLADLASKQSVTGDEFDIELIEPIASRGAMSFPRVPAAGDGSSTPTRPVSAARLASCCSAPVI